MARMTKKAQKANGDGRTPADPRRTIVLTIRDVQGVEFTISWDDVSLFRAFETAARGLATTNPAFEERTPAEVFTQSGGVRMPAAGAVAREAVMHLKTVLPKAIEGELSRQMIAAYATGTAAVAEAAKRSDGRTTILPDKPVLEPAAAMGAAALTDLRRRLIERAKDNARSVHSKRAGAPTTLPDAKLADALEARKQFYRTQGVKDFSRRAKGDVMEQFGIGSEETLDRLLKKLRK